MTNHIKLVTVFYLTLLSIAVTTGILYASKVIDLSIVGTDLIDSFKIISLDNILLEVGIISISFLLSRILIGFIIYLSFSLFKSFTLGFVIYTFIKVYGFKGALISSIYFLLYLIIFILLFSLMFQILKISKYTINKIVFKSNYDSNYLNKIIKKVTIIFSIYILYSTLLYLLNDFLLNIFKVLI